MTHVSAGTDRARELRDVVVSTLITEGTITSKAVEQAMRSVPRHRFAPGVALEAAYDAYKAVITKKDEFGVDQSSVSAPQIQAVQAEQADIRPGMKVLEIGSGGYNAALLAELVGKSGEITTVDIDPEVTDRAQKLLSETGYGRVRVVCADATDGVPAHGPYDRIIVTVGAWDIPPAWTSQLLPHGRLVVPLRMRGLTRSIAFDRTGDHLTSVSAQVCGFVPMQGAGAHREELLLVNGTNEIGLRFDDGLPADPSRLDNVVRTPRSENWSGVTIGRQESFDTLQMHLASALDGFCIMAVDPDLDTGLVAPANKWFSMAAVDEESFAYVTTRRTPDDASVEFGVHAFGPDADALAERVSEQVRTWDRERRGGPGPVISVFPANTADDQLPGERVIAKHHCRVTFSWPSAANPA
ncbi:MULTISPECIES: methyltransferase, FxLD system [unclassified Streptomyces]|uniref:methyltransferase, FxLD system n=1 Tax=Streptomyces sp. NPDC055082 TaxID=3365718 RepID=UPI0037CF3B72